jgi:hypothetical protein
LPLALVTWHINAQYLSIRNKTSVCMSRCRFSSKSRRRGCTHHENVIDSRGKQQVRHVNSTRSNKYGKSKSNTGTCANRSLMNTAYYNICGFGPLNFSKGYLWYNAQDNSEQVEYKRGLTQGVDTPIYIFSSEERRGRNHSFHIGKYVHLRALRIVPIAS